MEEFIVRREISDTQREAYEAVDRPKARDLVYALIAHAGGYGATLFELVRAIRWPVNRVSGRVTELRQAGRIRDTGERRINPETGAKAIVWEVI